MLTAGINGRCRDFTRRLFTHPPSVAGLRRKHGKNHPNMASVAIDTEAGV